jgi:hypothetical protein
MENSEYRRGRIAALFANALNALETELDRPDSCMGVPAQLLEDLNADVSALFAPPPSNALEFRTGYADHYIEKG